MEEKITMEITNDRLEEAIQAYATEKTKENLSTVLNLLRPTKLLVPAMLQAPDKPIPCFLKSNEGEQFLAVFTSKKQIPEEPKSQAILNMTFPACNSIVAKPELNLAGMAINPFTNNLVLKRELVEKLHEADKKPKQIKMTGEQFQVFVKKQVEFGILPKRLFSEKEEFINHLSDEKETLINQIFAETYKEPKLNPFTEADYSVMALNIAEDLTMIRVDFPEKGIIPPLCYRVYFTFNPQTGDAGYYTIEKAAGKDARILGGIQADGSHVNYGEAPVEGAELQKIMDLARQPGEITS